ncbi:MAG: hypothetical protein HZY79_08700 [Rhodoblastus sp.]|nr:MAG: hypothetical protein HZY79_08700 [Rhodoblastus sp.]
MTRYIVALLYLGWIAVGLGVMRAAAGATGAKTRAALNSAAVAMLSFGMVFILAFPAPLIGGDGAISLATAPLALLASPFILMGARVLVRTFVGDD